VSCTKPEIITRPNSSLRVQIRIVDGFGLAWMVGSYRGQTPYLMHGGGYVGASALYALMPEYELGIVVLANSSMGGQALAQLASIDLQDRLLGIESENLLPSWSEHAAREFAKLADRAATANYASIAGDAAADYAATYRNDDWGTLRIGFADGALRAHLGELPLDLVAADDGSCTAVTEEEHYPVHWVLDGGRPTAVELQMADRTVRFLRD
jgi:hypothetical protein